MIDYFMVKKHETFHRVSFDVNKHFLIYSSKKSIMAAEFNIGRQYSKCYIYWYDWSLYGKLFTGQVMTITDIF